MQLNCSERGAEGCRHVLIASEHKTRPVIPLLDVENQDLSAQRPESYCLYES